MAWYYGDEKSFITEGWTYRKSHEIIGSTVATLTDYQVRIRVDYRGYQVLSNLHEHTLAASSGHHAQYFEGTHKRTYFVYLDENYDILITYYDHDTKEWATPVKVDDTPGEDEHFQPEILVDSSGYIHLFYGCHDTPVKYAKSNNPEDISAWTTGMTIGDGNTYPFAVEVGANHLLLFVRHLVSTDHRTLYVYESTDGGVSWDDGTEIVDLGDLQATYIYGAEWDGTYVHLLLSLRQISDGVMGEHVNVYYCKYNPADKHVYTIDGTDLGVNATKAELEANYGLISGSDDPVNDKNIPIHLVVYGTSPYILYFEQNGDVFDVKFAKWNGSDWVRTIIMSSDHAYTPSDYAKIATSDGVHFDFYETIENKKELGKRSSSDAGDSWSSRSVAKDFTYLTTGLREFTIPVNYVSELFILATEDVTGVAPSKLWALDRNMNYILNERDHVSCHEHCRTDFGDIRFTKSDGITELDYWMEEVVDGDYAVFWVKVPSIPQLHPIVETGNWTVDGNTYHRRTKITVTEKSGNDLTDYQVRVAINTKWFVDNGYATPNGNEIRFTDSDGSTLLSFWRETDFNSTETVYWVKIPSLPASSSKDIYVYFDEELTEVSDASDIRNTFTVFDDFADGDYSSNPTWTVLQGTWSAASYYLRSETFEVDGGVKGAVIHTPCSVKGFVVEWKAYLESEAYFVMSVLNDANEGYGAFINKYIADSTNTERIVKISNLWTWTDLVTRGEGVTVGAWHTFKFQRDQNGVLKLYIDGAERLSVTDTTTTSFTKLLIHDRSGDTYNKRYDDIRVRKYVDPEPSVEVEMEGATQIYLYYGAPEQTTTSNGEATFLLFDDFNDNVLDTNKWGTVTGPDEQIVETNQEVWIDSGVSETEPRDRPILYSKGEWENVAVIADVKKTGDDGTSGSGGQVLVGVRGDASYTGTYGGWTNAIYGKFWGVLTLEKAEGGSETLLASKSFSLGTAYRKWELRCYGTSGNIHVELWIDDAKQLSADDVSYSPTSEHRYVQFSPKETLTDIYVDNVRVRKYVDPEPSHGAWGSEESI